MEVGLVVLLALMDLGAVALNAGVIAIIVCKPHLLHNLTNSFVLNLCGADLLSSLLVVPLWIANFAADAWSWPTYSCDIYGFVSAALSYATIWTVCLISVERYYSIAYPMLHAANLTLPRTLVLLASTWLLSALLAALPLLFDQECLSVYDVQGAICANVFADTVAGNAQWILVGVLCFCVPTAIVALMYALIFNEARNARRRVRPGVLQATDDRKGGPPTLQEAVFSSTARLSVVGSPLNAYVVDEGLESFRQQSGSSKRSFSSDFLQRFRVGKAARTIIGISGLFLGLWMPHFALLFYGSLNADVPERQQLETAATWLSFLTFVANPLLYGLGNRPIRQELAGLFRRRRRVACEEETSGPEEGDAEDFLQFLERTSGAATPKSGDSSSVRY